MLAAAFPGFGRPAFLHDDTHAPLGDAEKEADEGNKMKVRGGRVRQAIFPALYLRTRLRHGSAAVHRLQPLSVGTVKK